MTPPLGTIWEQLIHFPTSPSHHLDLASALFIGGSSKRMGRPKSMLLKHGQPLGSYLIELLSSVIPASPLLVGEGPMPSPWDQHPKIQDNPLFSGPLAGFASLHEAHPKQAFLVLAVDLYYLDKPALRWLLDRIREDPQQAIWPKLPQRNFGEPMAAYYPARALKIMVQSGRRGEFALHRALPATWRREPLIPNHLVNCFKNVNRPEDLPCSKLDL